MTWRQALSAGAAGTVVVVALATATAGLRHGFGGQVSTPFVLVTVFLGAVLAGVGSLLMAVRRGNVLGVLLLVSGAALVLEMALREIVYDGLRDGSGVQTWEQVLAWASRWLDVLGLPLPLVLVLLLFPDGHLPSRRWRPVVAGVALVGAAQLALFLLGPGPIRLDSHDLTVSWSGAIHLSSTTFDRLESTSGGLVIVLLLAAAASLFVRFWRGDADTRQRLKPLALAVAMMVVGVLVQSFDRLDTLGVVIFVAGGAAVPVALAVGALRYRVWDLDPFLVHAIVYAGLAVLVTILYVAVVQAFAFALGHRLEQEGLVPSVVATAVVAVLFAPARTRLERAARRLVFGHRATPYETLAALPQRLVDAPAVDEVLPATAQSIAQGLGSPVAGVSITLDDGTTRSTWYPERPGDDVRLESVEVRHLGDPIGELFVGTRPERPFSREDRRLFADLAAQAGPALRAVALSAELTGRLAQITSQSAELAASRKRLAVAQSQERRRLQRDLHDGAQQRLVATAMQLHAIRALIPTDPERALAELGAADESLRTSLDEIREVSRGLHPSILEARGLLASLQTRAEVARQRVVVEGVGLDGARLDPEVEAASYYCCLEALQNAAKHAPAADVLIRLTLMPDELRWTVADDGPGITPRASEDGSGLLGMRDRLAALGGSLEVTSSDTGTVLSGRLPLTVGPS